MTIKQKESVTRLKNDIFDFNYDPDNSVKISEFEIQDTIDSLKFIMNICCESSESRMVLFISKTGRIYFNSYDLTQKIQVTVYYAGIQDVIDKKNGF